MHKSLIIKILIFLFGLSTSVFAGETGKHKGPETSAEQKSEQGLEHGKAYAGTKEKKDDGDKDKGGKEKKDKGDKDKDDKEKKDKGDKDKDDKEKKDKGDKKEKKGKKGKKEK